MTDTTWTTTSTRSAHPRHWRDLFVASAMARFWAARVVTPLHRALDSALMAGELRELNAGTLNDLGYRRG